MKSTWISIAIALAFSTGCDEGANDPDMELRSAEGEPCGLTLPPDPGFHPPSYDCSERQDMGFDAGAPFDIIVVTVDGEPVEKDTANAFWTMREAAAADGVDIHIVSGFRTMEEQEYFYMCYTCCCCNDCNLAAQPGYSNHQSGHALDLNASAPGVYNWLAEHGGEYGFSETVPSENWHWEWWGGGPGGGICDITVPPAGSVDAAGCETISGWAQDPDAPADPVEVQVVFDGALGDPGAIGVTVLADDPRDDLCEAIGSCDHGFQVEVPLGLRDGANHSLRVYAIDHEGEMNAELAVTPGELGCTAPPIPPGVRRHVPDADAFASWGFSPLYHVAHVEDAALEAIDEGVDLGADPFLVTTDGSAEFWLVEHGWRRAFTDPTIAEAWGFSIDDATLLDAAALELIAIGPPVRERPFVVVGSGPEMWLVDDDLDDPREDSGGGDSEGEGDSDVGEMSDDSFGSDESGGLTGQLDRDGDDDGCGCSSTPRSATTPWLVVLAAAGLRRRRRATAVRDR